MAKGLTKAERTAYIYSEMQKDKLADGSRDWGDPYPGSTAATPWPTNPAFPSASSSHSPGGLITSGDNMGRFPAPPIGRAEMGLPRDHLLFSQAPSFGSGTSSSGMVTMGNPDYLGRFRAHTVGSDAQMSPSSTLPSSRTTTFGSTASSTGWVSTDASSIWAEQSHHLKDTNMPPTQDDPTRNDVNF